MEKAGKKPGTNLSNKLLNEPNMPTRWCIVLRISGDGVAWMQKDAEAYANHQQPSGELEPTLPLQPH